MLTSIDEKIKAVFENAEQISQSPAIEVGSDRYLDEVLYNKERFEHVTLKLAALNEELISKLNTTDETNNEHAFRILPQLKDLFKSFLNVVETYRSGTMGPALKSTLDNTLIEAKQLREIIDDVTNIKVTIKSNDRLQSLFSQL